MAGLYLSKYDSLGLTALGFDGFQEAFNLIGYAIGSRPASIKNYRDEFDPVFSNIRKGWHKRPMREYCRAVFEKYKDLDFESFTDLIKSFVGFDENAWSSIQNPEDLDEGSESSFARRAFTGLAAEQYFLSVHANVPEFYGCTVEDTRRYGCGYDFRLTQKENVDFLAVEVKGLREQTGAVSMTPKEHGVAKALGGRFFLFVVKNFHELPFHEIFQNPLSGRLLFKKSERPIVHVSWLANV